MKPTTMTDRRYGAVYGKAIGDALGIPLEWKTPAQIAQRWPGGGPTTYLGVTRATGDHWDPGDWSDDTEQALCILASFLDRREGEKPIQAFARHLQGWLQSDGRGCGSTTAKVLTHSLFSHNPIEAAMRTWEEGGQKNASNGGVMRAGVVGMIKPHDLQWTEDEAVRYCIATHYDPRCVASSVAVAVAVAGLIQGWGVDDLINEVSSTAFPYHAEVIPYIRARNLASLNLAAKGEYSYTYKAMGAGFWGLKEVARTGDVLAALVEIIRAGGDTDTNAAVAGVLLGAMVGLPNLPRDLVEGLTGRQRLHTLVSRICLTHPLQTSLVKTGDEPLP